MEGVPTSTCQQINVSIGKIVNSIETKDGLGPELSSIAVLLRAQRHHEVGPLVMT